MSLFSIFVNPCVGFAGPSKAQHSSGANGGVSTNGAPLSFLIDDTIFSNELIRQKFVLCGLPKNCKEVSAYKLL